ncbi:MAG: hypothetical protein Q8J69_10005 [Sphingobacteriaceae bacterium]|nr:hypothetical protein [Sphingobacteriaceae bacterium]
MSTLIHQTQQCFELLTQFLQQLPEARYQQAYPQFFGGTIGKHVRHILEFYQQLLAAEAAESVNYDARERQLALENKPQQALDVIDQLSRLLAAPIHDRALAVEGAVLVDVGPVGSTFRRELYYAYEHMVHHMALIKVGCFGLEDFQFPETFGLAYATAKHREVACAQ